jgi:uncharacterized membrane protein YfcA
MDPIVFFYFLLFVVAFLYASVGHGGASGYLALMALFSVAPEVMKPTALLLNIFVSLTAFIHFYRGRHFNLKLFWPFAVASIPMAYAGGLVHVDASIYKKMLGLLLLIPVIRFWFFKHTDTQDKQKANLTISLLIGVGIGGGIILSPVLLLLNWTNQKQTAAISALFILANSLSGLAGQLTNGIQFTPDMYVYVVIAFAGGLCGAYFGAIKFKQAVLQNVLATVLMLAACKLLFTTA